MSLRSTNIHVTNTKQATSFDVVPQGYGYVVIDASTGHPVTGEQDYATASFDCGQLRHAAEGGPRVLARALGAIENEPGGVNL